MGALLHLGLGQVRVSYQLRIGPCHLYTATMRLIIGHMAEKCEAVILVFVGEILTKCHCY